MPYPKRKPALWNFSESFHSAERNLSRDRPKPFTPTPQTFHPSARNQSLLRDISIGTQHPPHQRGRDTLLASVALAKGAAASERNLPHPLEKRRLLCNKSSIDVRAAASPLWSDSETAVIPPNKDNAPSCLFIRNHSPNHSISQDMPATPLQILFRQTPAIT